MIKDKLLSGASLYTGAPLRVDVSGAMPDNMPGLTKMVRDSYVIDPVHDGRPLTKAAQYRMCGNSVAPPLAAALVRANVPELAADLGAAHAHA